MANRLRELRKLRGLSLADVANAPGVNATAGQISKMERGLQRVTIDWARKLAGPLEASPADIVDEQGQLTVPLSLTVASAFSADRPPFDLPEPWERIGPPRRLTNPEQCLAAEVADDSCDRLYPRGTVLVLRRADALGDAALKVGDKVVVRRFAHDRKGGTTTEVLAGVLDVNLAGDLTLLLRTSNREIPPSVTIRQAPGEPGRGFRYADGGRYRGEGENLTDRPAVNYTPLATDPAEILGRIVLAITPED